MGKSYLSTDNIDRVAYSDKRNFTVNDSIGTQTISINTELGTFFRPIGIFSIDNGATWNEMGYVSLSSSSLLVNAAKPAITVRPISYGNGVVDFEVVIRSLVNGGSPFTLTLAFCLLLTDSPFDTTGIGKLAGKTALTSVSKTNGTAQYQKIVVANRQDVTTGSGYITIPHNLSYLPDVRFWNSDGVYVSTFGSMHQAGAACFIIDATNLYVSRWVDNTYLYRLYEP